MVSVKFVKTVVGWWNTYLVTADPRPPVTISPAKMAELYGEVSPKAKIVCCEINASQAAELFGELVKEVA